MATDVAWRGRIKRFSAYVGCTALTGMARHMGGLDWLKRCLSARKQLRMVNRLSSTATHAGPAPAPHVWLVLAGWNVVCGDWRRDLRLPFARTAGKRLRGRRGMAASTNAETAA